MFNIRFDADLGLISGLIAYLIYNAKSQNFYDPVLAKT